MFFGLPSSLSKWRHHLWVLHHSTCVDSPGLLQNSCQLGVSVWHVGSLLSQSINNFTWEVVCVSALHAKGIRSGKKSEANFRHNKNWRRRTVVLHDAFESYTATFRAKPLHTLTTLLLSYPPHSATCMTSNRFDVHTVDASECYLHTYMITNNTFVISMPVCAPVCPVSCYLLLIALH